MSRCNERTIKVQKEQDRAVLLPEQLYYMSSDGSDQLAFGLPHFVTKSKREQVELLKLVSDGGLEHKKPVTWYFYTIAEEHKNRS